MGEGSASRSGRFLPPGKTSYPSFRRLDGPQGRSGQVRKISPPTGIRSPDRPASSQSLYPLHYPAQTTIRSPDRPARSQSLYRLRYPAHTTILSPDRPARSQSLYGLRYPAHTTILSPDRPARSQSLYRLRYPDHYLYMYNVYNRHVDTERCGHI